MRRGADRSDGWGLTRPQARLSEAHAAQNAFKKALEAKITDADLFTEGIRRQERVIAALEEMVTVGRRRCRRCVRRSARPRLRARSSRARTQRPAS